MEDDQCIIVEIEEERQLPDSPLLPNTEMGEDQWIVEMEEERRLLNPKREEEIFYKKCIYKVPYSVRGLDGKAYNPKVVSLGPYHHHLEEPCCESCNPSLKRMEPVKHKLLIGFLAMKGTELGDVVRAMKREARGLMDAYDGLEEPWTDEDRFAKLMILDGCFVLAMLVAGNGMLLRVDSVQISLLRAAILPLQPVYAEALIDMVLLENQLPFRGVQILADLLIPPEMNFGNGRLEELMFALFGPGDPTKSQDASYYHMLDLLKRCFFSNIGNFAYKGGNNLGTITQLIEKGVTVEASTTGKITFSQGVLKMKSITLSADSEPLFANMIVFEKMRYYGHDTIRYFGFMDCLIDTAKDVTLLRERGIIQGWGIGSEEEVASIFKRLVKHIIPFYGEKKGQGIDEQLIEYCSKRRHTWWASFKHLYLKNPWVFSSMLAAIAFMVLTVIQVVYQMLDYYHS